MPEKYESRFALCPFYRFETSGKIVCEGLYANSNLHMTFSTATLKKEHADRFCKSWEFNKCPLMRMLEQNSERRNDKEDEE